MTTRMMRIRSPEDPCGKRRDLIVPALPAVAGLPKIGGQEARASEVLVRAGADPLVVTVEQATSGPELPSGAAYRTLLRLWSDLLGGSGLVGGSQERRHLAAISGLTVTSRSGAAGSTRIDDRPVLVLRHQGGTAAGLRRIPAGALLRIPADAVDACAWTPGGRWSPLIGHLLVWTWWRCQRARRLSWVPGDTLCHLITPPNPSLGPSQAAKHREYAIGRLRAALARIEEITSGAIPAEWLSRPPKADRRGRPAVDWYLGVRPGLTAGTQIVTPRDNYSPC